MSSERSIPAGSQVSVFTALRHSLYAASSSVSLTSPTSTSSICSTWTPASSLMCSSLLLSHVRKYVLALHVLFYPSPAAAASKSALLHPTRFGLGEHPQIGIDPDRSSLYASGHPLCTVLVLRPD